MRTITLPTQTNVLTPVRRPKEPEGLAKAGLKIRVFLDPPEYTAVLEPLHIAACGETPEEARESLYEAIAEYMEFLEESEDVLGPKLAEELRILRVASL